MKIVSFIDQDEVIRKIRKHYNFLAKPEPKGEGWWKERSARAPPVPIHSATPADIRSRFL
jgi:hypothetical protein